MSAIESDKQRECSTLKHLQWTLDFDWSLLTDGRLLRPHWIERATNWREGRADTPAWCNVMASIEPPNWTSLQNSHSRLGLNANFREGPAFCSDRVYNWYPELAEQTIRKLDKDSIDDMHPVAKAIRGYLDIIHIHPFNDGNTRAACLWFTWSLVSCGYDVPNMQNIIRLPTPPGNQRVPQIIGKLLADD